MLDATDITWENSGDGWLARRGELQGGMIAAGSRWAWRAGDRSGLDDEATARREIEVYLLAAPSPVAEPAAAPEVPWRALQRLERERAEVVSPKTVEVPAQAITVEAPPAPAPVLVPARPGEVRRWDITPSAYQAERDHVRRTHLELLRESPALYHHHVVLGHPTTETRALRLGRALHVAVLQPAEASALVVVEPDVNRRTNAGKAEIAAWRRALPADAIVLSEEELDTVRGMAAALRADPLAGQMLEREGERELPLRWTDSETDLPCKVMLDFLFFTRARDRARVLDLKSTSDPTPHAWTRSVVTFGYHRQAAFYGDATAALTGLPVDFLFLVVRSSPPYEVVVYDLDDQAVEVGRQQIRAALRDLARRLETSNWRAPWQGERPRPTTLSLPPWAKDTA